MRGSVSPDGEVPGADHRPSEEQEVSHVRVKGDVIQVQGTGGNVTITHAPPDHQGSPVRLTKNKVWRAGFAATATLAIGAAWMLHNQPKEASQPTPPPPSQPPLLIAATVNPIQRIKASNFDSFIFSKPAAKLPPVPSGYLEDPQIIDKWGYGNGGVDADWTIVEVVIQGRSVKSVVLTGMAIKVQRRAAPSRATTYVKVSPGADGVDGRWARVNLDKQAPITEGMINYSYSGEHPHQPWSFPLRVSQEAVEVIYLQGGTFTHDVQWTAELHFVAGGKPDVVQINDNGKPFRTVSSKNSVPYRVEKGRILPGNAG